MKPIAVIAGKAGTREAAKRVDAVRKHIAWTIFALVFICKRLGLSISLIVHWRLWRYIYERFLVCCCCLKIINCTYVVEV